MFIINTVLKPNKYGGVYYCKVFYGDIKGIKEITE